MEKKKAVDLHTAPLGVGYRLQPADLTVPDWVLAQLLGETLLFLLPMNSTNFISVSTQQLPWLLGEKCHRTLIN